MSRRRNVALRRGRLRAGGDTLAVEIDTPLEFYPLRNDKGRSLRITHINDLPIASNGAAVEVLNGQVELDGDMLTFTPDSLYAGPLMFRYTVSDGQQSRVAIVKGVVS